MVRRTWKPEEEKQLIDEFKKSGYSPETIQKLAKRFNRSPDSIWQKLRRLGILGLNVGGAKIEVSSTFEKAKDLPSLEEVLKIVAGALQKATEPGLGKTELQRLATIADLYKAYVDGLERYVRYRDIEEKLVELEKKYAQLAKEKTKNNATESDSA
jgi:hypothetical protein